MPTIETCKPGRKCLALLAVLSLAAVAAAEDQSRSETTAEKEWEVVYISGQRVGYGHTSTERITGDDGETIVVTDLLSNMQMTRFGQQIKMTVQQHTEEDEQGRMLRFRLKSDNPPFSSMQTVGVVEGDKLTLELTANGETMKTVQDWDADVKAPAWQDEALSEDIPDAGETRTLEIYEPTLNQAVTLTIVGHGKVRTQLLDGSEVEATKITQQMPELPPTDVYLDGDGNTIKTEMSLLGLPIVTYKVDEETALEEIGNEPLDLAVATLVPVERIPGALDAQRIVYRIEVSGGGAAEFFPEGPTQSVKEISDDVVELTVTRLEPGEEDPTGDVPAEYLESTRFLECTDPRVVEHADKAAADATDPMDIALAMERYVRSEMKDKNYSTNLATAAEVARELAGDCTEHAVLLAAMLRAKEIPSRVCVGLVYAQQHGGFAGHMWTEAFLGGRWVPLDGTLGRGGTTAAHIKLSDSSLAENAPTPVAAFLPIVHLMGKMKIEVLEVVGTTEGTDDTDGR